jgi:hypothetical protein
MVEEDFQVGRYGVLEVQWYKVMDGGRRRFGRSG